MTSAAVLNSSQASYSHNKDSFTVSDALDSIGINKFTWSIFFLVGLAMMFDGYDYMIVSYTMPQIAAEWGLDSVAKGSLSSWSMVGLSYREALLLGLFPTSMVVRKS